MGVSKLSVTVEPELYQFLERYQSDHHLSTKSEVVERALKLLRKNELERAYEEAAEEWAANPDAALWENTANDGLGQDG